MYGRYTNTFIRCCCVPLHFFSYVWICMVCMCAMHHTMYMFSLFSIVIVIRLDDKMRMCRSQYSAHITLTDDIGSAESQHYVNCNIPCFFFFDMKCSLSWNDIFQFVYIWLHSAKPLGSAWFWLWCAVWRHFLKTMEFYRPANKSIVT